MWKSLLKALLESCVTTDPMAYMYWLDAEQDAEAEAASGEQQASFRDDSPEGHHKSPAAGQRSRDERHS